MARKIVNLGSGQVTETSSINHPDPDQFTWSEDADGNILNIVERSNEEQTTIQAAKAQKIADEAELLEVKMIPFVQYLLSHTPNQISNKITNDIASDGVEAVIIKLAKVLAILAKTQFR